MKTERSYHPQNKFETKRRLLALPQKNSVDRHLGRTDCHLGAVCRRISYSGNAPNGTPRAILFFLLR